MEIFTVHIEEESHIKIGEVILMLYLIRESLTDFLEGISVTRPIIL